MKKIGIKLIGDSDHFTFEHRMFNFTLLLGIFMTYFGGIIDFVLLKEWVFWFLAGLVWFFLYYLSRFKRYFKIVSIISFCLLIFIFFPVSWLYNYGSHGVFPYYTIVFIAIMGTVLTGRSRYILIFSMIAVVILLLGLEYYLPGFIIESKSKVIRYSDIAIKAINITVNMFIIAVLIVVYSNVYKSEKERSDKYAKTIEEHYQQQLYYMENLEQLIYKLKAERHDFNHHLGVIYGLLEYKEIDKVRNYTKGLVKTAEEFQNLVNIAHPTLRAMLNYKLSSAKENNIELKLHINIPEELKLDEFDLTIILGNLLDNAIEACNKIKEKSKYVDLSILYKPNYLVIRIENPTGEDPVFQAEKNHTSKKDVKNHGFGLDNIEYIVNKHHGFMKVEEEKGVFKVNLALLVEMYSI